MKFALYQTFHPTSFAKMVLVSMLDAFAVVFIQHFIKKLREESKKHEGGTFRTFEIGKSNISNVRIFKMVVLWNALECFAFYISKRFSLQRGTMSLPEDTVEQDSKLKSTKEL